MSQVSPNEIPDIVELAATLYNAKGASSITKEQSDRISNFFMKFMGKAIEDCQNESQAIWSVTRPITNVGFKFRTVKIQAQDNKAEIEFIVGTTYGPHYNKQSALKFQEASQEAVLDSFSDPEDGSWSMVYNKLVFGYSRDLKYNAGLFTGIRFNKEHFVEPVSV